MSIFKYFAVGGKINYDMIEFIESNQEIKDYIFSKKLILNITDMFELRNLIIQNAINNKVITNAEATSKCNSKEGLYGFYWIKSIVECSFKVEITFADSFYNNNKKEVYDKN